MKTRWLTRIVGGMAALILSVGVLAPVYSGVLTRDTNTVPAAHSCDCSKCTSSQVCCKTANGDCGCFPGSITCP
jgi:hypothetical protein